MYGFDRYLYPVYVGPDNTIVEKGLEREVDTGIYYPRSEASDSSLESDLSDYPALFAAINDALDVDLDFEWAAPDGYEYADGLRMVGDQDWSLDFASSNFDFPPEFLGFPRDQSDTVTASEESSGEWVIESTRSVFGSWVPATITGVGATDKTSYTEQEVYASTDTIYRRTAFVKTRAERKIRRLYYQYVPALRVRGGQVRGDHEVYRELAGVAEATDGFEPPGYMLALDRMFERVNDGSEFLVMHGVDSDETVPQDGQWEACILAEQRMYDSADEWVSLERESGELYDVDVMALVVDGQWGF